MQIRVCNRCSAPVPALPAIVGVPIPPSAPATRPGQVSADPFQVNLSVQMVDPNVDLCAVCLVAGFVEYALLASKDALTPTIARKLQARINDALGFQVG